MRLRSKLIFIVIEFTVFIANDYKWFVSKILSFVRTIAKILSFSFTKYVILWNLVSRTSAVLENEESEIWGGFIWNVEGKFLILIFVALSSSSM